MDRSQRKVQDAVDGIVSELDRGYFRAIQEKMYMCSAQCCRENRYTASQVHSCIERCNLPADKSQEVMQRELSNFQERLRRCAMDCADVVQDKGITDPQKSMAEMEKCVDKCADEHIAKLPSVKKRIEEVLKLQK